MADGFHATRHSLRLGPAGFAENPLQCAHMVGECSRSLLCRESCGHRDHRRGLHSHLLP